MSLSDFRHRRTDGETEGALRREVVVLVLVPVLVLVLVDQKAILDDGSPAVCSTKIKP